MSADTTINGAWSNTAALSGDEHTHATYRMATAVEAAAGQVDLEAKDRLFVDEGLTKATHVVMPDAQLCYNKGIYVIRITDGTWDVTVADKAGNHLNPDLTAAGDYCVLITDGIQWFVIAEQST